VRAILRLAPYNLFTAALILSAGIAGGTAEYVLWTIAVVLEWASPHLAGQGGYNVAAAHFVERHGLVVIVAIGESVVAVGIAAAGRHIGLSLAALAVLGLVLSACLWWTYFGGDEAEAERALAGASPERRAALALNGYGYWHMLILLGIVAAASTLRDATGHPFADLDFARALALGGGVAAFLAGDALFRRSLRIGQIRWRATAALLALATIPVGTEASVAAQLGTLAMALASCLVAERAAPAHRPALD
jgi:low temperature requirement protein LtrA